MTQIAEISLTDNSNPQPNIVDHSGYQGVQINARASIHSGEDEVKAFDNDSNTKWLDNAGVPSSQNPSWIEVALPSAKVVNSLAITSANDAVERDPKSFTLKGSNDSGANWVDIESWSNETWNTRFERRVFTVANTDNYQVYRLSISENQGNSSMTQIAEIELLGPEN